jgi:hypothetical protein
LEGEPQHHTAIQPRSVPRDVDSQELYGEDQNRLSPSSQECFAQKGQREYQQWRTQPGDDPKESKGGRYTQTQSALASLASQKLRTVEGRSEAHAGIHAYQAVDSKDLHEGKSKGRRGCEFELYQSMR